MVRGLLLRMLALLFSVYMGSVDARRIKAVPAQKMASAIEANRAALHEARGGVARPIEADHPLAEAQGDVAKGVMVDRDGKENVNDVENDGQAFVEKDEDDNDREDALSLQQEGEVDKAAVGQVTTNVAEVSGDFVVSGAGYHNANGRYKGEGNGRFTNGKCKFWRSNQGYVPGWSLYCFMEKGYGEVYYNYHCTESSPNNCCRSWQPSTGTSVNKLPNPRLSPSSCQPPTPRRRFCLGGCR